MLTLVISSVINFHVHCCPWFRADIAADLQRICSFRPISVIQFQRGDAFMMQWLICFGTDFGVHSSIGLEGMLVSVIQCLELRFSFYLGICSGRQISVVALVLDFGLASILALVLRGMLTLSILAASSNIQEGALLGLCSPFQLLSQHLV